MNVNTNWLKKMGLLLLLICLLNPGNYLCTASESRAAKSNYKGPFQNMAETTFPKIGTIKFKVPAANQPCPVQVEITGTSNDKKTRAKITTVKLIYYVNGDFGTPAVIAMSKGRGKDYNAFIPGMASGSRVDFIIRAEDSNGNVATQAIPSSSRYLVPSIVDIDDPSESLPWDDLDLLTMAAGYDNKYIYVQSTVKGKISPGTTNPPLIHVYAFKFTNPDQYPKENLYTGQAVCYIPLAVGSGLSEQEKTSYWMQLLASKQKYLKVKKTGAVFANIQDVFAQKAGLAFPDVEYQVKAAGNKLTAKISRAAFGKNPSGYLRIISLTCRNKSLSAIFPLFMNCSNFLDLYTSSQSYTVE